MGASGACRYLKRGDSALSTVLVFLWVGVLACGQIPGRGIRVGTVRGPASPALSVAAGRSSTGPGRRSGRAESGGPAAFCVNGRQLRGGGRSHDAQSQGGCAGTGASVDPSPLGIFARPPRIFVTDRVEAPAQDRRQPAGTGTKPEGPTFSACTMKLPEVYGR